MLLSMQPKLDEQPPSLTVVGGLLAFVCVLVCIAVVAAAAFVGIPIPGTSFVLHSVGLAVLAGLVVGGLIFFAVAFLLKLVGVKVTRDPD